MKKFGNQIHDLLVVEQCLNQLHHCVPHKKYLFKHFTDWWKWFADHISSESHNFRNIMFTTLLKKDQNSISNGYQYCFLHTCGQRSCLIWTDNNQGDFFHWIKAWFQQLSLIVWNRVDS